MYNRAKKTETTGTRAGTRTSRVARIIGVVALSTICSCVWRLRDLEKDDEYDGLSQACVADFSGPRVAVHNNKIELGKDTPVTDGSPIFACQGLSVGFDYMSLTATGEELPIANNINIIPYIDVNYYGEDRSSDESITPFQLEREDAAWPAGMSGCGVAGKEQHPNAIKHVDVTFIGFTPLIELDGLGDPVFVDKKNDFYIVEAELHNLSADARNALGREGTSVSSGLTMMTKEMELCAIPVPL